jgi:hypothetical protein
MKNTLASLAFLAAATLSPMAQAVECYDSTTDNVACTSGMLALKKNQAYWLAASVSSQSKGIVRLLKVGDPYVLLFRHELNNTTNGVASASWKRTAGNDSKVVVKGNLLSSASTRPLMYVTAYPN